MKIVFIFLFLINLSSNLFSQTNNGTIIGKVIDSKTNQGVPFASIAVWETTTGVIADQDGNFTFSGLKPGFIVLHASSI
ncbi:MAG TPA: carboxypeptidase-like regulatory domain-containing protein, partial [Bacteroidales bacterium]|nr:carboxypeptidase-like regulatory domain-containing protein [Bacteroidales bacterium]